MHLVLNMYSNVLKYSKSVIENMLIKIFHWRNSSKCTQVDLQVAMRLIDVYSYTVKPVCNDHLSDKIYYLWFIQ